MAEAARVARQRADTASSDGAYPAAAFWGLIASSIPRASASAGPFPQTWRQRMRGCSPIMCEWIATVLMPAARSAPRTPLELGLEHREVTIDERDAVRACKGRPGVGAHRGT